MSTLWGNIKLLSFEVILRCCYGEVNYKTLRENLAVRYFERTLSRGVVKGGGGGGECILHVLLHLQ